MNSHSLLIYTLQADYILDISAAERMDAIQERLDRIARDLLPSALERRFARMVGSAAPYVFIDELEVHFDFDSEETAGDDLASAWARSVDDAVRRAMTVGAPGTRVYGSQAEFTAAFIEDLITGRDSETWHYEHFHDIRSLTPSQALTRLLTQDPDLGRELLMRFTKHGRLTHVLGYLGDGERARVVRTCLLPDSPSVHPAGRFSKWIDSLERFFLDGYRPIRSDPWSVTAEIYLNLLQTAPELGPDVNLARFIHGLVRRARSGRVQDHTGFHRDDVQSTLDDDYTAGPPEEGSPATPENQGRFDVLLKIVTDILSGKRLAAGPAKPATTVVKAGDRNASTGEVASLEFVSDFAGLYLLIPTAVTVRLSEFLPQPTPADLPHSIRTGLLLYLIASQCLGAERWPRVQTEGSLHHFAGLDSPDAVNELEVLERNYAADDAGHTGQLWQKHLDKTLDSFRRTVLPTATDDYNRWFSAKPFGPGRRCPNLWFAVTAISSTLLRAFASELGAFAGSSPEYIARNFLEGRAIVTFTETSLKVSFVRSNLKVLLRMLGYEDRSMTAPWLKNRIVTFYFE